MQTQRWGDVVSISKGGTIAAPNSTPSSTAATVASQSAEQQNPADDSNFAIADGDDYEEF